MRAVERFKKDDVREDYEYAEEVSTYRREQRAKRDARRQQRENKRKEYE
jgi:hypothetical protein